MKGVAQVVARRVVLEVKVVPEVHLVVLEVRAVTAIQVDCLVGEEAVTEVEREEVAQEVASQAAGKGTAAWVDTASMVATTVDTATMEDTEGVRHPPLAVVCAWKT